VKVSPFGSLRNSQLTKVGRTLEGWARDRRTSPAVLAETLKHFAGIPTHFGDTLLLPPKPPTQLKVELEAEVSRLTRLATSTRNGKDTRTYEQNPYRISPALVEKLERFISSQRPTIPTGTSWATQMWKRTDDDLRLIKANRG